LGFEKWTFLGPKNVQNRKPKMPINFEIDTEAKHAYMHTIFVKPLRSQKYEKVKK
jgi:hypothetical protein